MRPEIPQIVCRDRKFSEFFKAKTFLPPLRGKVRMGGCRGTPCPFSSPPHLIEVCTSNGCNTGDLHDPVRPEPVEGREAACFDKLSTNGVSISFPKINIIKRARSLDHTGAVVGPVFTGGAISSKAVTYGLGVSLLLAVVAFFLDR